MKKVLAYVKKEPMLFVSLAAALVSLLITPPSPALLEAIDWKTLATLFMLLCVLDDPDYEPTREQIDVARAIVYAARDRQIPGNLEMDHFIHNAEVYAGMTVDEYRAYTRRFLDTAADRFHCDQRPQILRH